MEQKIGGNNEIEIMKQVRKLENKKGKLELM